MRTVFRTSRLRCGALCFWRRGNRCWSGLKSECNCLWSLRHAGDGFDARTMEALETRRTVHAKEDETVAKTGTYRNCMARTPADSGAGRALYNRRNRMSAVGVTCLCGEPLRIQGNFCVRCGRENRQLCPVCFDERRLLATVERPARRRGVTTGARFWPRAGGVGAG